MLKFFKKLITDTVLILFPLILFGLFYFQSNLIWASLIIIFILVGALPAVVHEEWTHKNIVPKNKWIGYVIETVTYLTVMLPFQIALSPKFWWCYAHHQHHKIWKTPGDVSQKYVDNNHWTTILFTSNFRKLDWVIFPDNEVFQKEYKKYKESLGKFSTFLNDHFISIIIIFHLVCLLMLGVETYFYLILFPIWTSMRFIIWFSDVLPHQHKKTKQDEHDLNLFWLGGAAAYHITHHYHVKDVMTGKGWRKYFDVQYLTIRLFYNLSPNTTFREVGSTQRTN
jgi:hypothetical protein